MVYPEQCPIYSRLTVKSEKSVGEGTLLWATPCLGPSRIFLNEKKINIFRLMHIALFLKVIYQTQILLKKIHILYCFSCKVTFSITKVNFCIFDFIATKSIHLRTKIEIS